MPPDNTEAEQSSEPPSDGSSPAGEAETTKKEPMSVTRRGAIIGVSSCVVLLGLGALRYAGHTPIIHPPGGQDETNLVTRCIRCEKCYESCPRDVIAPAHIEYGLLGMRAPTMNYDADYCDYCQEENGGDPRCAAVCPTGALTLPQDATAQNVIIGKASIDTHQCLAYRMTACRQCYDNCPYDAIYLENEDSRNPLPVVDLDKCNGCGACEAVCLSLTTGSIVAGSTERAIKVHVTDTVESGVY